MTRRVATTAKEIVEDLNQYGGVIVQPPHQDHPMEVRLLLLRQDDPLCACNEAKGFFSCPNCEVPVIALSDLEALLSASGCNYDCDQCSGESSTKQRRRRHD